MLGEMLREFLALTFTWLYVFLKTFANLILSILAAFEMGKELSVG